MRQIIDVRVMDADSFRRGVAVLVARQRLCSAARVTPLVIVRRSVNGLTIPNTKKIAKHKSLDDSPLLHVFPLALARLL